MALLTFLSIDQERSPRHLFVVLESDSRKPPIELGNHLDETS